MNRCGILRRLSPVLFVSLAFVGCKDGGLSLGSSGPTARTLSKEVTKQIDVVHFSRTREGATGGTSPAKVILKPNPSGDVRVAVFEEFSGGAGEQWRASAWMASFLASHTLGRTLSDYEFGVSAGGLIDGPSAGALTTAAMMAAMTDTDVRPDVTMTGTANPDGTVGPVGGIPQKIRGAAKAGKKVFGYPVGQRYDLDLQSGQVVDLHAVASEVGIEAREVRDIWDAYALLTGKSLPRAEPLDAREMDISPTMFARMQAKTTAWLSRVDDAHGELKGTKGQLGKVLAGFVDNIEKMRATTFRYQTQGMVPAAFSKAREAQLMARAGVHFSAAMRAVMDGDKAELIARLRRATGKKADIDAFVTQIATTDLTTVDQALAALSGYQAANLAYGALAVANESIAAIEKTIEQGRLNTQSMLGFLPQLSLGLMYGVAADVLIEAGRDIYETPGAEGKALALDAAKLELLAKGYTSAAKANLDYYDALVLRQQADVAGASLAAAQAQKAVNDPSYLMARQQTEIAIRARDEKGVHQALQRLAAAFSSYTMSAALVAKEYSLGAQQNAEGELQLARDKALISMLEIAELRAREAAALAKRKAGAVPDLARATYQTARADREGDLQAKLSALEGFWGATEVSQLAVALATR